MSSCSCGFIYTTLENSDVLCNPSFLHYTSPYLSSAPPGACIGEFWCSLSHTLFSGAPSLKKCNAHRKILVHFFSAHWVLFSCVFLSGLLSLCLELLAKYSSLIFIWGVDSLIFTFGSLKSILVSIGLKSYILRNNINYTTTAVLSQPVRKPHQRWFWALAVNYWRWWSRSSSSFHVAEPPKIARFRRLSSSTRH